MENHILKKGTLKESPFFISYLITDPNEYGSDTKSFEKIFKKTLKQNNVDMVCFRDKETKDTQSLLKLFKTISKQFKIPKIIINTDIEKAIELELDGVHLNSKQFNKISYSKQKNLYTIISCHTEDEIIKAKKAAVDAITYSPIFYKEDKGEPKGCEKLKYIVEKYQDKDFKIIALGGIIEEEQIEQIKATNCFGFASIRYFTKLS